MSADWNLVTTKANFALQSMVLEVCVALSLRVPGHSVEFGVANGNSARIPRDALTEASRAWREAPLRTSRSSPLPLSQVCRNRSSRSKMATSRASYQ